MVRRRELHIDKAPGLPPLPAHTPQAPSLRPHSVRCQGGAGRRAPLKKCAMLAAHMGKKTSGTVQREKAGAAR